MKKLFLFPFIFWSAITFAQEMNPNNSSSLYSVEAKKKLVHIVDSLNLKFKKCEINKTYLAKPQTFAYYIKSEKDLMAIKNDIEKGISIEDFAKKYPDAIKSQRALIVKDVYKNYEKKQVVRFTFLKPDNDEVIREDEEYIHKPLAKQWVYDVWDDKTITAFYFPQELSTPKIPQKYADMINYVDCMVDTTTNVILANDKVYHEWDEDRKEIKEIEDFKELIKRADAEFRKANPTPERPKKAFKKYKNNDKVPSAKEMEELGVLSRNYGKANQLWYEKLESYVHKVVKDNKALFDKAYQVCIKNNISYLPLEEYGQALLSKDQILELKRRRRVFGSCSMDNSPAFHAKEIAELAAQTAKWEIFLRSHLDILNENFERVAYSSYGEANFPPFFSELEDLNISVFDLMIGTLLQSDNLADNHYYGSVGRVGRGFAETKNREEVETNILSILQDKELDLYNRLRIYFMFTHYLAHLEGANKIQKIEKLKQILEKTQEDFWQQIDWQKLQDILTSSQD